LPRILKLKVILIQIPSLLKEILDTWRHPFNFIDEPSFENHKGLGDRFDIQGASNLRELLDIKINILNFADMVRSFFKHHGFQFLARSTPVGSALQNDRNR